jgi:hypothetical protein
LTHLASASARRRWTGCTLLSVTPNGSPLPPTFHVAMSTPQRLTAKPYGAASGPPSDSVVAYAFSASASTCARIRRDPLPLEYTALK